MGTHVMLEAAKCVGKQIRRFIHVSTDEVYGESTIEHGMIGSEEKFNLKWNLFYYLSIDL